jgi:hypothetical protein
MGGVAMQFVGISNRSALGTPFLAPSERGEVRPAWTDNRTARSDPRARPLRFGDRSAIAGARAESGAKRFNRLERGGRDGFGTNNFHGRMEL